MVVFKKDVLLLKLLGIDRWPPAAELPSAKNDFDWVDYMAKGKPLSLLKLPQPFLALAKSLFLLGIWACMNK